MNRPSADRQESCVIYARYSSHNQREVSIEQQVSECEAYARSNGWRVVRVYADRHLSGTTDQRPQFQQMLKDSERGRWSVVLTWKVDRFARDRYDSAHYKHRLKKHGVRVVYAKEVIPEGPEGILMEAILEGSAEYYSANLAQNVRRGMRFNAEAGIANGSMPYGYRRGPDGHFEVLESEAMVVREIFRRVAAGELRSSILADLNARKVPTRRGGSWKHCTLRVMLENEAYVGVYHCSGVRLEGAVPPIVDTETWEEVKKRMDSVKGTRVRSESYLLTGRTLCGLCGEPMIGRSGTGRSGTYSYYVCRGQRDKHCSKKAVRRELLEDRVVSGVVEALNDDRIVSWIADSVMQLQEREADEHQAAPAALRAELADVKRSIKRILDAIEAGVFTPSTKGRLLELEERQDLLEAAMEEAALPVPGMKREEIIFFLTKFRRGPSKDREAMRDFAGSLIWKVRVWDDHADAILNFSGVEEVVTVPLLDEPGAVGGSGDGSPGGDSGWLYYLEANRSIAVSTSCVVLSLPLVA